MQYDVKEASKTCAKSKKWSLCGVALKGTTVIMIAQRVASVMNADKIAVIDNGRLAAFADHKTLLETCEVYRDIYSSQMREGDEQVG